MPNLGILFVMNFMTDADIYGNVFTIFSSCGN